MRYNYKVKTLSPVHIGSGNALTPLDYVFEGGSLCRVNVDEMLKHELDIEQFIDRAGQGIIVLEDYAKIEALKHLWYKLKIDNDARDALQSSSPDRGNVKEFIKTRGLPYLPGSSLKGSMRTCLAECILEYNNYAKNNAKRNVLGAMNNRDGLSRRRKKADNYLGKTVFGGDPGGDIGRVLQVSDTQLCNMGDLEVGKIVLLKKERGSRFGWQSHVFLECLTLGTTLNGVIKLDDFLIKHDQPTLRNKLGDFKGKTIFLIDLAEVMRESSMNRILREKKFYEQIRGEEIEPVIRFYTDLEKKLEEMNEGKFLLQVGWGTGWQSKTVSGYLKQEGLVHPVVESYRLDEPSPRGRRNRNRNPNDDFPVTRNIHFCEGEPSMPLGWMEVELTPVER